MVVARQVLFIAVGLLAAASATAADPLFESHDTLQVRIDAPLTGVLDERDSGEYFQGRFHYNEADGSERSFDIQLRARGRYRRQARTCRFPPIRINFRKKQLDDSLFDGQDKLKLVTHCRTGSDRYEQLLLREFLAYRILQLFTDNSFRVRLLSITWNDTSGEQTPFEHYGFFIEDEDRLGKRLGLKAADKRNLRPAALLPEQASLIAVFQYLIGNTDFSFIAGPPDEKCCHNIVPYVADDKFLVIPYDFDFAGIVDAPYATPNPKFKLTSVKTRLYRGRCEHNDLLPATAQQFMNRRSDIYALINNQEGMEDRIRKRISSYLDRFYKTIEDENRISRQLIWNCAD